MKIRNSFLCRTVAVTLAIVLGIAGTAFAAETVQPRETEAATAEAPAAEPEIKTFGTESEGAVKFELTNSTGKDITFFNIRVDDGTDVEKERVMMVQEVLIEQGFLDDVVDGSFGPMTKAATKAYREANGLSAEEIIDDEMLVMMYPDYDDGNILDEGDVIKADETVVIWFVEEPEEETAEENAEEGSDQGTDAAFNDYSDYDDGYDYYQEFDAYSNFVAEFKLAEDEMEYALNTLALGGETMQIKVAEDIAYIEYTSADYGTLVSTYETEYAIKHPPVVYENPAQGNDGCIDVDDALTW